MSSHANRWKPWVSLTALAVLAMCAACFDSTACEKERCDGRDNDCDRRIDEDFQNARGVYSELEHCGACGLACDAVYPTAAETRCHVEAGRAQCEIVRCADGEALAGSGACAPETTVTCLPCGEDGECALRSPGARCLPDAMGGGRCAPACASGSGCPDGFRCRQLREFGVPVCLPASGSCRCDAAMEGAEFGCTLRAPDATDQLGAACAGVQRCEGASLGECVAALGESCNEVDDDCDGRSDEGFTDAQGEYTTNAHCGRCGAPCAAPGPHMIARCERGLDAPECRRSCLDGFVDLDGLGANGCECEIYDGSQPRLSIDANCDGENDPAPELVFVSQAGDDAFDGQSADTPLRTLARGLALGAELGRDVLIARGVYEGSVNLPAGIAVTGGYSPDFQAHDPTLYPVLIEGSASLEGAPVVRCEDVHEATRLADVTIEASAADAPGMGSTALLLDGCGPEVALERVTILAARAAPGRAGEDSSAGLAALGFRLLSDLTGSAGGVGMPGGAENRVCQVVAAGAAGMKRCAIGDVGGGRGGDARCSVLDCENGSDIPCGNAGCTDFTTGGVCDIAAARAVATPNPAAEAGRGEGAGRAGVASYDSPTNHGACSFCDDNPSLPRLGDDGGQGRAGADGAGGELCTDALAIDTEGRIVAADGGDARAGADGAGGGGGSAGSGFTRIRNTRGDCVSVPGGAGGGGGSGGCGAPAAAGGGGGGGSIGVLIRVASGQRRGPRLLSVRVVTASGGDGGDGGSGAAGGGGGSGGIGGPSEFFCARNGGRGGDGGRGGAGGGGAGGCGGPSVGVFVAIGGGELDAEYRAALAAVQVELAGGAGRGGRAGYSPGVSGAGGRDGVRAELLIR